MGGQFNYMITSDCDDEGVGEDDDGDDDDYNDDDN